jgi:hypothetical protein
MTFVDAILHFDSAVGLTTVDFSIEAKVQSQKIDFRPKNYPIDVEGAFAHIVDVPLFLGIQKGRPFSGICGVVVFAFDHGTYRQFENGLLSDVQLYNFGRAALEFIRD